MELAGVAHKYFLINLRLPVNDTVNTGIGEIKDIYVVVSVILLIELHIRKRLTLQHFDFLFSKSIHQNGGFTKVWISMKTVFSPWIVVGTAWYWHRIRLTGRPPVLLEKYLSILLIGCHRKNIATFFNFF